MSILAPHDSLVLVIVRFEHFELLLVWVLGGKTGTGGYNPPKWSTTQHWF
jgi:hypothetical protein